MNRKIFVTALIFLAAWSVAWADSTTESAQQKLKDGGFYYGDINGKQDADTTAAIRRYQIRNGLEITGELNEETLKSIRSNGGSTAQAAPAPGATIAPPVQPAPETPDSAAGSVPPEPRLNAPPV